MAYEANKLSYSDVIKTLADRVNIMMDFLQSSSQSVDILSMKNIQYTKLWEYANPTQQPIYSTPITATFSNSQKVIIYMGWDWYIYVHDLHTGNLIWRYATGGNCYGRCQAGDINGDGKTEILAASHDGAIYCLSETGSILWTFKNLYNREASGTVSSAGGYCLVDTTKNWATNSFIRSGSAQGGNASIHITSGTGAGQVLEISGVDGSNHSKLWTFNNWTTTPDSTSQYTIVPKYSSDTYYQHAGTLNQEGSKWYLYITGFDGQCVKIDASNGSLVWKYSALDNNEPFPIITDINKDGALECLFASIDGNVYCINAVTGTLIWKTTLPNGNDALSSFADIDNDGVIEFVVNSRADRCYILNGNTGAIKYTSTNVNGNIDTKPVLYDINGDGYQEILFGCDSGYVYALDYQAHTLWRFLQGTVINSSTNVVDVNGDGIPEILSPDMNGTVSILNPHGVEIGQVHIKGGIEGVPLVGDLDNDGNIEMLVTSTDGYVKMVRFQ